MGLITLHDIFHLGYLDDERPPPAYPCPQSGRAIMHGRTAALVAMSKRSRRPRQPHLGSLRSASLRSHCAFLQVARCGRPTRPAAGGAHYHGLLTIPPDLQPRWRGKVSCGARGGYGSAGHLGGWRGPEGSRGPAGSSRPCTPGSRPWCSTRTSPSGARRWPPPDGQWGRAARVAAAGAGGHGRGRGQFLDARRTAWPVGTSSCQRRCGPSVSQRAAPRGPPAGHAVERAHHDPVSPRNGCGHVSGRSLRGHTHEAKHSPPLQRPWIQIVASSSRAGLRACASLSYRLAANRSALAQAVGESGAGPARTQRSPSSSCRLRPEMSHQLQETQFSLFLHPQGRANRWIEGIIEQHQEHTPIKVTQDRVFVLALIAAKWQ